MRYRIKFLAEALKDIETLRKSGNKSSLTKIYKLLKELEEHPYTGTGNPEPLKEYKDTPGYQNLKK